LQATPKNIRVQLKNRLEAGFAKCEELIANSFQSISFLMKSERGKSQRHHKWQGKKNCHDLNLA
jgi:hypothetical protein